MALKKFAAQADEKILRDVRKIAKEEGKYFSTLINEAFKDLIDKRKSEKPRSAVLEEFEASLKEYSSLYEKLAK